MKTVALIEGFAGGPLHTRQFRRALTDAGFQVTKNRGQADIIIAHSAGIYAIPANAKAKLLMLIGPTYWPGQPLIKRVLRHTRTSRRHHVSNYGWLYYFWKKLLEIYYFFRRHSYMWRGILNNNRLEHLHRLTSQPGRKTIFIRNRDDPFSSPDLRNQLEKGDIQFVELPGVHDDYVKNPQPYIDLLLKEL